MNPCIKNSFICLLEKKSFQLLFYVYTVLLMTKLFISISFFDEKSRNVTWLVYVHMQVKGNYTLSLANIKIERLKEEPPSFVHKQTTATMENHTFIHFVLKWCNCGKLKCSLRRIKKIRRKINSFLIRPKTTTRMLTASSSPEIEWNYIFLFVLWNNFMFHLCSFSFKIKILNCFSHNF